MNKGYIYIREHDSYNKYNACKLGKTKNIIERDSQYATGEIERGIFKIIIELELNTLDNIENKLQYYFKDYHIYFNGGIEFYDKKIINLIIPYIETLNINFKILTEDNIIKILRENKINEVNINPYDYQLNILNIITNFYIDYNICKLIWACGLGKTLLSILIIKKLNFKSVVIGVPSKNLQIQFRNEILKIFSNIKNILFIGCINEFKELNNSSQYKLNTTKSTTCQTNITKFINKVSDECKFIITTYDSCYLLCDYNFDFKIGDEAHHLVGLLKETEKNYQKFHYISSKKTLFMTATEKIIDSHNDKIIYSMNDENIFGTLIDSKSVKWAIENKKITDYVVVILKNNEEEFNYIINNININIDNKELFIIAYMILKAIEMYNDLTHILSYTNSIINANLIQNYINEILKLDLLTIDKFNLYNESLHSKLLLNLKDEVSKFEKSKFGIISCVYIFGEGFDLPKLNGVAFCENMESDIRIVQSALRPNRIEKNNPYKKAYIIIPYIDKNGFFNNNGAFNKCRKIISKLRNVDENIENKINIITLKNSNVKNNTIKDNKNIKYEIILNNPDELNKLKLRLRYSKALCSDFSEEQDEFNYVQQLNKELNILSKEEYIEVKNNHSNYIEDPENYFKHKGVWTNWYDFLKIDKTKFIKDKREWQIFCNKKNIKTLLEYEKLCHECPELPQNPAEFYENFSNIMNELNLNKRR
jgi:predicted helicase